MATRTDIRRTILASYDLTRPVLWTDPLDVALGGVNVLRIHHMAGVSLRLEHGIELTGDEYDKLDGMEHEDYVTLLLSKVKHAPA